MFETVEFRQQIQGAVSRGARPLAIEQYDPEIVSFLHELATENEHDLMQIEMRKATGRRGIPEAMDSVMKLVGEASLIAAVAGRKVLTLSDVQRVYVTKYCSYWPFCK